MKQYLDYGIYIDHQRAYIVAIHSLNKEKPATITTVKNPFFDAERHVHNVSSELQNKMNENERSYCRSVVALVENPHHIVIFGPAETKYVLHVQMQRKVILDQTVKEILVTDAMHTEQEACDFTLKHFNSTVIF